MNHCVLSLLACIAFSQTVSVISPLSLQQKYNSGVPVEFALFGAMPYGSYVAGKVLQVSSSCCSECSPSGFNASVPAVFLVPRGNCTFDTMVHYAEVAKARAVIIYNANSWQNVDLMESAGYYNVSVPSALIAYSTTQDILAMKSDIILNITFEISSRSSKVEVGAVYALKNTYDLLIVKLLPSILDFGANTVLKPYFALLDCPQCDPLRANSDCLCNNQYCSLQHPQGGFVVRESVRQQCVYQLSNSTSYVAYMTAWAQYCYIRPTRVCVEGYSAAGVSSENVQQCYLDSFGGDANSNNNTLLATAQAEFKKLPVYFVPAIVVAGKVMHGDYLPATLERMVCAHLSVPHAKCSHYFCAPGCWPDMLSNLLCDPACNVDSCSFDLGSCKGSNPLVTAVPTNNSTGETGNNGGGSTTTTTNTGQGGTDSTGGGQPGGTNNGGQGTNPTSPPVPPTNPPPVPQSDPPPVPPTNPPPAPSSNPPPAPPCSPGCNDNALNSSTCVPACNNTLCSYQNWVCTCAKECSPDMLQNDICDSACNVPLCNFDNGACTRISLPEHFSPDMIYQDSQDKEILDTQWEKGLVIGLGVLGSCKTHVGS